MKKHLQCQNNTRDETWILNSIDPIFVLTSLHEGFLDVESFEKVIQPNQYS